MFIHTHLHTEYSLRDSLIKISGLIEKVKEYGMTSVAITDHGSVSGALEFYLECQENNIKPIIGMEAYVVKDASIRDGDEKRRHVVLLAKNEEGYKNLMRLASEAGKEGFYYVPRADIKMIREFCSGLICLTACSISSVLYITGDGDDDVGRMVRMLYRLFGEDFYLEIQPHDLKEQKKHNILLSSISRKQGVPLIATQDVHFIEKEDKEVHDILMQIQGREPYDCNTLYLATEEEIMKEFKVHDYLSGFMVRDAVENAMSIADKVGDYNIPIGEFSYPSFELEEE
jgi:DNA polymerase-3 subunit alpha